jgi:hypothetical protein
LICSNKEIPALVEKSEIRQKNVEKIPESELTSAAGGLKKVMKEQII